MNAVMHALAPYQDAALALVSYLVAALWMGVAIVLLAALVLKFWKPLDAAARYAVWYAALIAVVLGPLAVVGASQMRHAATTRQFAAALGHATPGRAPVKMSLRIAPPAIAVPAFVAFGTAGLWLLIVLAGSARFAMGAVVLARLKHDALPLSPEHRAALPLWRARAERGAGRRARLCVSDRVEVPVAVGLFDGMVVLPQQVLDEFEPSDVDRFVLHELAHLERRDDWTAVVQRIVQTLMFFNPAVHVIARRLDLEREIACDDRVVAETSDVRSYAVGLTRMAESTAWPHRGIAAPAIFVTRRQLSLRVEELLARRRVATRGFAIAPAAVALAASLGVVAVAAPLAPTIGVTDTAQRFNQVFRTQVILVNARGKKTTVDAAKPGALVIRGEFNSVEEFATKAPVDAQHIHALLKKLEADRVKHGVNEPVTYHITQEQLR